jgi:iron complex outermembrane recepter protein
MSNDPASRRKSAIPLSTLQRSKPPRLEWGIAAAGLSAAICGLFVSPFAAAQTTPALQNDSELTTVVVTGSRIRRTDTETPSPIEIVTNEDLLQSGFTNTQEVLKNLTANGQGTLSQSFSGAFASGAAGIALRGLNVGYTLVLIDGHRTAPYPIGDDGQRSFVDVSNIPFDSIERIEVLKDGASAIYGSDAIAGVVNIILKKSFVGTSITADAGTSSHADGTTSHFAATFGKGDLDTDGHNFYIAAEFRHQEEIRFEDRGGIFTNGDFTGAGGENVTRGAPNANNGGFANSATGYIIDPNNSAAIAGFMPGCNAATYAASQCTYKDTWDQIQPTTSNYNVVGKFTQKLSSDWTLSLQGTFFEGKSQQINSPGNTFANGFQGVTSGPGVTPTLLNPIAPTTISNTNPTFPAGTGLTSGLLVNTLLNLGPTVLDTDSKSYRAVADLDGKIGVWDFNASAGYTEVRLDLTGLNGLDPGNLQTALDSTTAPFLVGQPNTAAVNNFIAPQLNTVDTSKLYFVHAGVSDNIAQLPGGGLGLAFGADYFQRKQDTVAAEGIANGTQVGFSNNFTVGTQDVAAGYVELVAPIIKQFEVDAAVRYDHYNLSGGKASPKIGFKFTPVPEFAIRGTAARGFRAPGPAENGQAGQTFFAGSTADAILCKNPANPSAPGNFVGQCNVSLPGLQGTNPDLKPETSKSYSFGFIYEPIRDISATLDLYTIEIDNQIVAGGPSTLVRSTNLAPIAEFQPGGGTALVAPPVGPIQYFTTSFVNANRTFTDGWDVGLVYHHRLDNGWQVKSEINWTYIHEFELSIDGVNYQLAGTHGPSFFSGDTGNPKSRVAWANTAGYGPWSATITVNYISSFNVTDPSLSAFEPGVDASTCLNALSNEGGAAGPAFRNVLSTGTVPGATSCTVNHFTTVDLYSKWSVTDHLDVHGSVTNMFNAKAPLDWATYGAALGAVPFNPSLHLQGAIGPFFTVGATYKF